MTPTFTEKRLAKVALLGTFPPRRCGIATFSADLACALAGAAPDLVVDPIAMSDQPYPYQGVRHEVAEDRQAAYAEAAATLNERGYDVLSVQHEFGIYGGESGGYLLNLVREVRMPVVTTLHTVLHSPTLAQRQVLEELIQLSSRIVVMSNTAIQLLSKV